MAPGMWAPVESSVSIRGSHEIAGTHTRMSSGTFFDSYLVTEVSAG
jgi:hypothetical protein